VIGHTECSQSTTQQTRVARCQNGPMNYLREGAAASVIFAMLFCGPLSAFAQRAHKLVDTFDQRYPVEQVPTPALSAMMHRKSAPQHRISLQSLPSPRTSSQGGSVQPG